jgi:hypothetical protein
MELQRDFYTNIIFHFHAIVLLSFMLLSDSILTFLCQYRRSNFFLLRVFEYCYLRSYTDLQVNYAKQKAISPDRLYLLHLNFFAGLFMYIVSVGWVVTSNQLVHPQILRPKIKIFKSLRIQIKKLRFLCCITSSYGSLNCVVLVLLKFNIMW